MVWPAFAVQRTQFENLPILTVSDNTSYKHSDDRFVVPMRIPPEIPRTADIPLIDAKEINNAAKYSRNIIKKNLELENELVRKGFFQRKNSMEAKHQAFFGGPDPEHRRLAKDGLIALETTIRLAKK